MGLEDVRAQMKMLGRKVDELPDTEKHLEHDIEDWDLAREWLPVLRKLGRPGEKTGQQMLDELGPLGILQIAKLMMGGKSEGVRFQAAREIAHMGGFKPVERSQSLNVNVRAEAELDALLRSKLSEFGIEVIEAQPVESLGEAKEGSLSITAGERSLEESPPSGSLHAALWGMEKRT